MYYLVSRVHSFWSDTATVNIIVDYWITLAAVFADEMVEILLSLDAWLKCSLSLGDVTQTIGYQNMEQLEGYFAYSNAHN